MERLRDRVWIWGHAPHSLVGEFGLDGNMTPTEGMHYFGAKNVFYVPMHQPVDIDACNEEMKDCSRFGWSVEMAERIDVLTALTKRYGNFTHAIFDDFYNEGSKNNWEHYTPESLSAIKEKLHTAGKHPIEMWVVYYTMNESENAWTLSRIFDGVALWFWHETTAEDFEKKCAEYFERTKGQKHMIGCYLYDFGNKREISPEAVVYQLNRNKEFLKQGLIDGFILHTNGVADLGYAAVAAAKEWMEKNGDEII